MTLHNNASDNDWQVQWNARQAVLETVLGPSDDVVLHSRIPFYLNGAADVLRFRQHIEGIVYATADLIGDERSKPNILGQFELMICLREDADWAPLLISNLAKYTVEAVLAPGDTMDIGPALPQPTHVSALLYLEYARFAVSGKPAGLLLCIGITDSELAIARREGSDVLVTMLKQANVYPFTILNRTSLLHP